jgi:hypothetical protein
MSALPTPSGTFTPEAAQAAQSVHNWTRFAALIMATAGSLLLVVTLILAGSYASKYPAQRGLIAGVGTAYAAIALVMLCYSFLLVRYGQKLELSAKQRAAAPLVEALPYETGAWGIAAGYIAISVLALVLSLLTPAARPLLDNGGQAVTQAAQAAPEPSPFEGAEDAVDARTANLVCRAFAVVGLALVISALKPV